MAAPVIQLRVPEDTLARIDQARGNDTRFAWLQRVLDGQPAPQTATGGPITLPGEPCPGAVCSGPGCWNRDTAAYGLRRLVLCQACAAALQGNVHKRLPPGAERVTRHRAA